MPNAQVFVELLEDRTAPATFGIPWQDPSHLTLSFVPDSTSIGGHTSNLFSALNSVFQTPAAWQSEIVQAFQTWAVYANISVGLVSDSGAPLGVAGRSQGDPRFGDIRIGAQQTSSGLAIAVPPDPYFSGTLAGDVLLNSSFAFNSGNLFAVMLHEAGHSFGLEDNNDPNSVMYRDLSVHHTTLAPEDITALQALYGVRNLDRNGNNGSFTTATKMDYSGIVPSYTGTTPVVAYGDLSRSADADYFSIQPIPAYTGPITFRLIASGISFLALRVTVYDQNEQYLGQAQSTSDFGDIVSVRLPQSNPLAQRYYIKVDSPVNTLFAIGRYALTVTFDSRLLVNPTSIPGIVRGPYDDLTNANDMAQLFSNPTNVLFNSQLSTNVTFQTAQVLESTPGYPQDMNYQQIASLNGIADAAYYQIPASRARPGSAEVLTVRLTQLPVNGVLPIVSVYDAATKPVSANILLNGNGTYTIQVSSLTPSASYYLKVTGAQEGARGNYSLVAFFGSMDVTLTTFASSPGNNTARQINYNLYIAETQLLQFVLSTGTLGGRQGSHFTMNVYDSAGNLVFTLTSQAGTTVSGPSVLLRPGAYHVRFVAAPGALLPAFRLSGLNLSDPIGAASNDPTMQPMYQSSSESSEYSYPDGTTSSDPYEWQRSGD
jgi:hypothetical protein